MKQFIWKNGWIKIKNPINLPTDCKLIHQDIYSDSNKDFKICIDSDLNILFILINELPKHYIKFDAYETMCQFIADLIKQPYPPRKKT